MIIKFIHFHPAGLTSYKKTLMRKLLVSLLMSKEGKST